MTRMEVVLEGCRDGDLMTLIAMR